MEKKKNTQGKYKAFSSVPILGSLLQPWNAQCSCVWGWRGAVCTLLRSGHLAVWDLIAAGITASDFLRLRTVELGSHRRSLWVFCFFYFFPNKTCHLSKRVLFFLMAVQFLLVICTTNMSWAGFYFDSWGHTIAVFFSTLCVLWRGNYFAVVCMDFFFNL